MQWITAYLCCLESLTNTSCDLTGNCACGTCRHKIYGWFVDLVDYDAHLSKLSKIVMSISVYQQFDAVEMQLVCFVLLRVRDLTTARIGALTKITGQVVRTHPVHPELVSGVFVCLDCRTVIKDVEQQFKYTQVNLMFWTVSVRLLKHLKLEMLHRPDGINHCVWAGNCPGLR